MKKKSKSNWSTNARALKGYSTSQLLSLLKDLYILSEEARLYLDTKLNKSPSSTRLKKVMTSTNQIGWGYHDTLADMYLEAFGEYE